MAAETALQKAFVEAGYQSAADRLLSILLRAIDRPETMVQPEMERSDAKQAQRLKEVSLAAIKQSPRNWDGAKDALFKLVRNDPELLWEMFQPYRAQAAQRLLTEAAQRFREEELMMRGHLRSEHHATSAANHQSGAGHHTPDNHQLCARPTRKSSAGIEAIASVAQASLLDTFKINGRAIGDLTSEEANKWASSRERDARFVRLLTQNLPPQLPIRSFRTADDAAQLYAQAEDSSYE